MTLASRVIVVDDDAKSLRSTELFLTSHGHTVVTCSDPALFLDRPAEDAPSCVVLELDMASMSGLEVQTELARRDDSPPLVFTSRIADVAACIQALRCGAVDFLSRPFGDRQLLDAIARSLRHDEERRAARAARQEARDRLRQLTDRERQVCGYLMFGRLNKQIAAELSIAESTVKVHRSRAMKKLHLDSLVGLVRFMDQAGAGPFLGAADAKNMFTSQARAAANVPGRVDPPRQLAGAG